MVQLGRRYPGDRMALLSSLQDQVIRAYFQETAQGFQTALLQLAADDFDSTANLRYYFIPGSQHTLLGQASTTSQGGVNLLEWLRREIQDDPSWVSIKP
jgi:hypothetical protein